MKKLFKDLFFKLVTFLGKIFYDKKYLQGQYFSEQGDGWWWVFRGIWFQKILRFNSHLPFPANPTVRISNLNNLVFGSDNLNNFQSFGIYFQNFSGKIYLGDRVYLAPNVGLITANHDFNDLSKHLEGKDIHIGNDCWIGMNSVVLPGVKLGNKTIVGAGSVVTKSFEEGNLIIGGNPAKILKKLEN